MTRRYPRAVQILEPFLDHPDEKYSQLALNSSAHSYERMGNSARARQLYLKSAEADTSDLVPLLQLLRWYVSSGALKTAQETADKIFSLDPKNRDGTEAIAIIQLAMGDLVEARDTYAAMLETEGDRAAASPQMIKNYITVLIRLGEPEVALEFARQNEAIAGGDREMKFELLMETNQVEEEVDELLLKLRVQTDSPLIAEVMGARAINDGDWELAVGLLSQAALKMSRSIRVFKRLELAATKNNQAELAEACRANLEGIRDLEQRQIEAVNAIGDDMEDPELRLTVAEIAVELARLGEAARWVDAAAMVAPDRQVEILDRKMAITFPTKPLVPIGAAFSKAAKREAEPKQSSGGQSSAADETEANVSAEAASTSDDTEPTPQNLTNEAQTDATGSDDAAANNPE